MTTACVCGGGGKRRYRVSSGMRGEVTGSPRVGRVPSLPLQGAGVCHARAAMMLAALSVWPSPLSPSPLRSGLPASCVVCAGTTDSVAAFVAAGVSRPGQVWDDCVNVCGGGGGEGGKDEMWEDVWPGQVDVGGGRASGLFGWLVRLPSPPSLLLSLRILLVRASPMRMNVPLPLQGYPRIPHTNLPPCLHVPFIGPGLPSHLLTPTPFTRISL